MRVMILSILALAVTPAFADLEPATGSEIEAAISGDTVDSKIHGAGRTVDYFAEDGEMLNENDEIESSWTVEDDALCMTFNGGSDCWRLSIEGDSITWLRDGEEAGTGKIRDGNPEGL
ncbi:MULTISPECIES: hypothetical protein [unclassified Thioalkalivibrio]|uniref:hypothetical protein n=1 Tax=unclassified Thioalkalivibrio TaxID=2621013 RepID=UPI00035F6383|nr:MULTISPECIES: hypothetical protein [unclassified Thioalkalivibrio]